MDNVYAVILAGGVGSRFWPASRRKTPKQFLDLIGDGRTMVAATVERLLPDVPYEQIIVVTAEATVEAAAAALPHLPEENLLVEPLGRNTAACVGWAALHVRRRNPNAVMAVMPSDHLVSDAEEFKRCFGVAVRAASEGAVALFGVQPRGPETGFGYVETGAPAGEGLLEAVRFVEKPDVETAKRYVSSGRFLWNSGMFFFTAERILTQIDRLLPKLSSGLATIDRALGEKERETEAVRTVYPKLPSISIDYGIMEHISDILCVPVDFGWHDVGSWSAAHELSSRDSRGNAFSGDVLSVDAEGCFVRTCDEKKAVALVNVKDLIIVDTGDALLVCNRADAQSVKEVVSRLKEAGRKDLL